MKKLLALVLALLMCTLSFAACSAKNNDSETTAPNAATTVADDTTEDAEPSLSSEPVRVFTLKGPTGMGMAKLIHDNANGEANLNYNFTVANAADEFTGDIIQGNFEVACVPTNLASVLYSKTNGAVSVAAVNTLGVLHILEAGDTIKTIADLEGKTVYSSGKGAVPEYALNYILNAFGINCEVVYEAEHDVVVSDLVSGKATVAVLPEPKVTAALKNENAPEGLRTALDLNDLWNEACEKNEDSSSLYMGCVIVNAKWAEENPNELAAFLAEYKESAELCTKDVDTAASYIEEAGIIPKAPVAKAAMANCHIVFITGDEMITGLEGFLNVLYKANPAAVGGKLPDEAFYKAAK